MRIFGWCVICKRSRMVDVTTSDVRRAEERGKEVIEGVCSTCDMNQKEPR